MKSSGIPTAILRPYLRNVFSFDFAPIKERGPVFCIIKVFER